MRAFDMHIHVPEEPGVEQPFVHQAAAEYFRSAHQTVTPERMNEDYTEWDMKGLIFPVDTSTTLGLRGSSNDWTASIVHKYPDRFVGFCSVDPWQGKLAIKELERSVKELGLKGLKLHPNWQEFFPSEQHVYPLYRKCVELGVPVLFHVGFAGAGGGTPGGMGMRLKYSAPLPYIDDLGADMPDLTIIMAHPGFPWEDEAIAVCHHKGNVFMDLSGYMPRHYSQNLIHYCNTRLQDKVLFGTGYPLVRPDRWLEEFSQAPFRDEVRPKILYQNALRVLGMA